MSLLHLIDHRIGGDDVLGKLGVAVEQRLHGVGDLLFRKPAHFGDPAGDLLQIGVEGAGGMVDSRGGFGHGALPRHFLGASSGDQPKRPVM